MMLILVLPQPLPAVVKGAQIPDLHLESLLSTPVTQTFPDMQANYQRTVVAPAQAAQEAQQEAQQAAEEAQAAQPAPVQAQAAPKAPVAVGGTCSEWMNAAGITDQASAYTLLMMESGCNPNAVNASSGACGLGQQLPCGKWPHTWNDPVGAMIDMQAYTIGTYGSWANALAFHYSHNWY